MPKRISKKQTEDVNETAFRVVQESVRETETNSPDAEIDAALRSRVMAEMGRKGGKIGGKKSLQTMTPAERKKRAQKAAQTRWKKSKKRA